jgi:hypothetical protein
MSTVIQVNGKEFTADYQEWLQLREWLDRPFIQITLDNIKMEREELIKHFRAAAAVLDINIDLVTADALIEVADIVEVKGGQTDLCSLLEIKHRVNQRNTERSRPTAVR